MDKLKLKGVYDIQVLEGGKLIDRRIIENVITDIGKELLFDYLTGQSKVFINHIALGLSNTAANTAQTDLFHEIYRARVDSATYDLDDDKVSFHTTLAPHEAVGVLGEIGVFDRVKNESTVTPDDLLIANFDLADEFWTNGVADTTNFKEGEVALKITTSGTQTVSLLDREMDLSVFDDDDVFAFWVYASATTNFTSLVLRFEQDATNYFEYSTGTLSAAAWNYKSVAKNALTTTGSPSWDDIAQVRVLINQSSAAAIDITLDSLRVITQNLNSRMFSRQVISPLLTKSSKQEIIATYSINLV